MRAILLTSLLLTRVLLEKGKVNHLEFPSVYEWIWAFFGLLVWHAAFFTLATDELDGTRKKFKYKNYVDDNWPNWLFSALVVPVIVFFAKDVWYYVMKYFEKDWEYYDVLLLGSGPFAEMIFIGIRYLKNIRRKLSNSKD